MIAMYTFNSPIKENVYPDECRGYWRWILECIKKESETASKNDENEMIKERWILECDILLG